MTKKRKILITGGAGLVGQNLVIQLQRFPDYEIIVIDKNHNNLSIFKELNPSVRAVWADLSKIDTWADEFSGVDAVVMAHAQIGGIDYSSFHDNNLIATQNILQAMKNQSVERLIHISSSVVSTESTDWYTVTKKDQEQLVTTSSFSIVVLRPTLMFGWFDRKHLGWLSRLMSRTPCFPIPGSGLFTRQPLFVNDFCSVIQRCIEDDQISGIFDITGQEKINYLQMIKMIKATTKSKSVLVKIPVKLFHFLLWLWAKFDANPPFTIDQLNSLIAGDEFPEFDWPIFFSVKPTKFEEALLLTFNHRVYSAVVLDF